MTWTTIRLELARTPQFPNGSAARNYTLRLPLTPQGLIDPEEFATHPERATVRRFWPNEPDQSGYMIRKKGGWAFSYVVGEDDDENIFHLENHPVRIGEYLTLLEPDGDKWPYQVKSCAK
ncbi:MAG: hypothetical protein JJE34_04940 [Alphaproteobacteria bacterium]|nr:hypothetical protein [Alphaproteobacteria bacterium]